MPSKSFLSPDAIRANFSAAISAMYQTEVPAYGELISLVRDVNAVALANFPVLRESLEATDSLARISEERHGAIRLGTASELAMMRRVFAVMGMFPVGYYDLSEAGVPVHATAFRPIMGASLMRNPFRMFTSLVRLELIDDVNLRKDAERILAARRIFTDAVIGLVERAEHAGGLTQDEANEFVTELLNTFRWHTEASIDRGLYRRLHSAHRLIADVVSFRGPHINHLTPRTLDIDTVQEQMPARNIIPKAIIEGPPSRACPILLRQTSFKAIQERVSFRDHDGKLQLGSHSARFGEIEQRGIALTPKGRALYDKLLGQVRAEIRPAADGSNADAYRTALRKSFSAFPDDWSIIRKDRLGYFSYTAVKRPDAGTSIRADNIDALVADGLVRFDPIVYEDFLPVSAAGIFQSNLGDETIQDFSASPNQREFERALGTTVLNEFESYAALERSSLERCLEDLQNLEKAA